MEIIKMVEEMDGPEDLIYGPAIPLNFSIKGGAIMDTRRPLEFYTDHENFEDDIRHQVDVTVRQYMAMHNVSDYKVAMNMVFMADPEMKARYAKS